MQSLLKSWSNRALLSSGPGIVASCGRIALLLLVVAGPSHPGLAQTPPRTQQPEVKGMLKSLIDNLDAPALQSTRDPAARTSRASQAQLRDVRANLAGFAQEITQLVSTLHHDVNRTDGIRSLFGDALKVNASATLLARHSASETSLQRIAGDFQPLDRDWRLLSFRLQQIRDLSGQARSQITQIEQYDQRLGLLLQITPQIDRGELSRKAAELSSGILTLLEEIDYEVEDATSRYNLLVEGRRVYEQNRRMAYLASRNESYELIRKEYEVFQRLWSPLVNKIRPLQHRHIDRQLRRVQTMERDIQELLWMPNRMDRAELVHLTQTMRGDVDAFLDGITLRHLIRLPAGEEDVVKVADSFNSACSDFSECVTSGEHEEDLAQLYYFLEDEWKRLAVVMREAPANEVRQQYHEIDRSIKEIRVMLGVQPAIDRQRALRVASALQNLAGHYQSDVVNALSNEPNRYSSRFRAQCNSAAAAFYDSTRGLHLNLQQNANRTDLRRRCDEVKRHWDALQKFTEKFPEHDRNHLTLVRRQIAPNIVDMQALISL